MMNLRIFLITMFFSSSLLGQQRQCSCLTNGDTPENTIECKITTLKNGYKLYWQFNCDAVWLTLENKRHKKVIIDHVPKLYQNLTYRLGFGLVREFENSLLFRHSCPANGPCNYTLINKYSGQPIKRFGVLIDNPGKDYQYNFVVYLSHAKNYMKIYFPDSKKLLQIPVDKKDFFYPVPEDQFDKIRLTKKTVILTYETSRSQTESVTKTKTFNIGKYSR